jgi:hypothetical protein
MENRVKSLSLFDRETIGFYFPLCLIPVLGSLVALLFIVTEIAVWSATPQANRTYFHYRFVEPSSVLLFILSIAWLYVLAKVGQALWYLFA